MVQTSLTCHPSSDSVVVKILDSHAAVLGLIPGSDNGPLSKITKILFSIGEQLSMLKFIIKCLNVIYYMHFPLPGCGKVMTREWKSEHSK